MTELEAWKEVHQKLVEAIMIAREGVAAQKAQKRFWLEEFKYNQENWKKSRPKRKKKDAPSKSNKKAKKEEAPAEETSVSEQLQQAPPPQHMYHPDYYGYEDPRYGGHVPAYQDGRNQNLQLMAAVAFGSSPGRSGAPPFMMPPGAPQPPPPPQYYPYPPHQMHYHTGRPPYGSSYDQGSEDQDRY